MKIAREIELRLERLVDGLSASLFRGRMHPVDLANRLVRFVDLSVREGPAGPSIANRYEVRVSSSEIEAGIDLAGLESELASVLSTTAAEHGWRTGGPIRVAIRPDDGVPTGAIKCVGESVPGPIDPWCQLINARTGEFHEIGDNRVVIGRGTDADVRIDHARVSRRHATLFRVDEDVWIRDLGSSNGTALNGHTLEPNRDTEIAAGDSVSFGPAEFSFRVV